MNNLQRAQKPNHKEEDGSAIVEGAMVFGLFFFLLFAIVEFGLFFLAWNTGRNTASEAAHQSAIVGKSNGADYSSLRAVRDNLNTMGGSLDYIIVYRANGIKDKVPAECIAQAELGRSETDPLIPFGVFEYTKPSGPDAGPKTPETFDWFGDPRPEIACNVYYRRQLQLPVGAFVYDRARVEATPSEPSLDRFWPGGFRVDRMSGPVDFLGVYVSTSYASTTGLIPSRRLKHNAIIQIESRSTF